MKEEPRPCGSGPPGTPPVPVPGDPQRAGGTIIYSPTPALVIFSSTVHLRPAVVRSDSGIVSIFDGTSTVNEYAGSLARTLGNKRCNKRRNQFLRGRRSLRDHAADRPQPAHSGVTHWGLLPVSWYGLWKCIRRYKLEVQQGRLQDTTVIYMVQRA